jgi:hypothetical protein
MAEDRVSTQLRMFVSERAQFCCEYCWSQESFATQSFSIEHIVPKARGGLTDSSNLAFACQGCNGHKSAKLLGVDPIGGDLVRLFNPRSDVWQEHFLWNEDYSEIVGLTAVGRTTIFELRLNRSNLVNLRQALYTVGKHPPDSLQP